MRRWLDLLAADLQVTPASPGRVAWGVVQVGCICGAAFALIVFVVTR